jgi:hypothetical protein
MDSIMPNGDAPIATSQIGQAAQAVVYPTRGKDIVRPRYLVIAPCRRGPSLTIRRTTGVDPIRSSGNRAADPRSRHSPAPSDSSSAPKSVLQPERFISR